jgi:hypothetical protein
MEAAGATEVKAVASTSGMEPSPSVPGTSAAATIAPAWGGTTSARATRATKTSTPIRPSSEVEAEGDNEDFSTVMDNADATLDGSYVELMLEKSVKPSTREKYSRLWDKWVCFLHLSRAIHDATGDERTGDLSRGFGRSVWVSRRG